MEIIDENAGLFGGDCCCAVAVHSVDSPAFDKSLFLQIFSIQRPSSQLPTSIVQSHVLNVTRLCLCHFLSRVTRFICATSCRSDFSPATFASHVPLHNLSFPITRHFPDKNVCTGFLIFKGTRHCSVQGSFKGMRFPQTVRCIDFLSTSHFCAAVFFFHFVSW